MNSLAPLGFVQGTIKQGGPATPLSSPFSAPLFCSPSVPWTGLTQRVNSFTRPALGLSARPSYLMPAQVVGGFLEVPLRLPEIPQGAAEFQVALAVRVRAARRRVPESSRRGPRALRYTAICHSTQNCIVT